MDSHHTPTEKDLPKVYLGSGQKTAFDRTEQIVFKIYSGFILIGMVMTLLSLFYGFEPGLLAIYAILLLFIYVIKEVRTLYERQQVIIGTDYFEQILGEEFYSYAYADIEELSIHTYFGSDDVAFIIIGHPTGHRLLLRMENMNQLAEDLKQKIGEAKHKKIENVLGLFFFSALPSWSIPLSGILSIIGFYFVHHYDLRPDFLISMALLLAIAMGSYSYLGVAWGRRIQSKILWAFPLVMIYCGDLALKNHHVNMCKVAFNESCFRYTYFYGDTLFTDEKQKEQDQMSILRLGCEKNHPKSCMELGARIEESGPTTALTHYQRSCELNLSEGCIHSARVLAKQEKNNDAVAFLERGLNLGFKSFWFIEESKDFSGLIKSGKISSLLSEHKTKAAQRLPANK